MHKIYGNDTFRIIPYFLIYSLPNLGSNFDKRLERCWIPYRPFPGMVKQKKLDINEKAQNMQK